MNVNENGNVNGNENENVNVNENGNGSGAASHHHSPHRVEQMLPSKRGTGEGLWINSVVKNGEQNAVVKNSGGGQPPIIK